jgi:hypothetical protein
LTFSILAPSVINLCFETSVIVLLDTNDEEKSEKVEKNIEDKILTIIELVDTSNLIYIKKSRIQHYLESNSDYTIQVFLPPPELS